ncbi:hypothetical protein FHQ28_05495 [Pasteurellaceae bacterium USgator11]|nr:hypothetical protein FHQ20_07755 [Pasteurellaceae bacterium USgator41]TNG96451.1 hypothetical protein FHQ19_01930 [Pasteurellaceae bacterium UScroc12]TNH00467.1 hypothetical protein FHQ24_03695 [Pasteurellaceae bacterium UScroc31]TNH01702.1 hypothetical protein FHQ28_05495 [Pasteurellaceae bacterium USgator11]
MISNNYTQTGRSLQVKMPECYPKESHDYIVEQLMQLPFSKRDRVCKLYSAAYREAYDLEPVSYRKENKARFSANVRLRKYVKNYRAVTQGLVSKPPKHLSQGQGVTGASEKSTSGSQSRSHSGSVVVKGDERHV